MMLWTKGSFVLKILSTALLSLCLLGSSCNRKPEPPKPVIQQIATHRITFEKNGDDAGVCTGTAIGPHALMTAHHCNDEGDSDTIRLDMTLQEKFHIEKILTDGRDHDVYLLDGPAFTNVAFYKTRPIKVGEPVYVWGDGDGVYPPRKLTGVEAKLFMEYSDVDARSGLAMFTMKVIPGDSGSIVWSEDGYMLAVTTYLHLTENRVQDGTIDFQLAFTDDQIIEAETFSPAPFVSKAKPSKLPMSPFSFGFPFNIK
jgi:hypothetical protein